VRVDHRRQAEPGLLDRLHGLPRGALVQAGIDQGRLAVTDDDPDVHPTGQVMGGSCNLHQVH
jgi:hypothetical protein